MIENEVKFVLHSPIALEERLRDLYSWHDIEQGYLHEDLRIRRIATQADLGATFHHVFAFKRRLSNGRNFEVEPEITEEEFNNLWPMTTNRLLKRRFSVRTVVNLHEMIRWDIDFPRWPSGRHFAIAEAEMPAWMDEPPDVLSTIAPYIVYKVPRSDSRFSARRLSDEGHARNMAIELGW